MKQKNTEEKGLLLALLLPAIYPILAILFNFSDVDVNKMIMANQMQVISGVALLLVTVVAACCLSRAVMAAQPRYRYNW